MSNFVVSARKYRPSRFEDVVGQEHVTNTLKNALRNDHLAHAFLFCGPRGVGKTTCARILAKVLNCRNVGDDFEPCNTCDSCLSFNENASFNITELDAASNNSVEHIRALIEQVRFQPQQGKYKVFIIDEVHMLSQQAFNAFLKTLEEPPEYAIFILATTEKHKIIPTILSRCQIFDFKRIQVQAIVQHLQAICDEEQLQAEPEALHIMAQKADGALRDALSIFDRMVSFSGSEIRYTDVIQNLNVLDYDYFFQVVDALLVEDMPGILLLFDEILNKGFDPDIFMNGLAEHFRNLLVCKDAATLQLLEVSDRLKERYLEQAHKSRGAFLLTGLNLANDCDIHYKTARNKRLHVEMALIKMAYINRATDITANPEKKIPDPSNRPLKQDISKQQPPSVQTTKTVAPANQPPLPKTDPIEPTTTPSTLPKVPANGLKINKKIGLGASNKLGDVDTMLKQLKAEEAKIENQPPARALSLEALKEVWNEYTAAVESASVRNLLKGIDLQLEEKVITATVSSKLSENALRQERNLIQQLRETFGIIDLILQIKIDKSKLEEAPKPKKPMTDKEKLKAMYDQNPEIKQLAQRFGLRFDDH